MIFFNVIGSIHSKIIIGKLFGHEFSITIIISLNKGIYKGNKEWYIFSQIRCCGCY